MFADDTNLSFNHKDIKDLFTVVNNELVNINDWFTAHKLSLNVKKNQNTHSSISQYLYIRQRDEIGVAVQSWLWTECELNSWPDSSVG